MRALSLSLLSLTLGFCALVVLAAPGEVGAVTACGGSGQRACCVSERVPSCNTGLVEIPGCSGDCTCGGFNPLGLSSIGRCTTSAFPAACGDPNERACTIVEHIPSCKPGLVELLGVCRQIDADGFPAHCGGSGEPACLVLEHVPSCKSGLAEVPFPGGTCIALDADGFPPHCGGHGERACLVTEHVPSCKSGLVEVPFPGGVCITPDESFPPGCGDNGERPCTVAEHIPSCKSGLRELPQDFGVCGTDPENWGETDAHEEPRGGPRTLFFIHGASGDIAGFATVEPASLFQRLVLEAPNITSIYGVDWNNAPGSPPRKLLTRKLVPVDRTCVPTATEPCTFRLENRSWGTVEFDGETFRVTEIALALAEAITTLPTEPHITLLAHSFGGVIARQLVYRHYDELRRAGKRIVEVVTMGTPHRGGLAGDLSLANGRAAQLQKELSCLRLDPPVLGAELSHVGCELAAWIEWMKDREDGGIAPFTPLHIDNRGYPQIRWIILAANGQRLDLGAMLTPLEGVVSNPALSLLVPNAREFLDLIRPWDKRSTISPFPDSDATITTRSAFGITADECYPFTRSRPPSGRTTAEVRPVTRSYVKGATVETADSAVCFHLGARRDSRVTEGTQNTQSDDPYPDELLSVAHGDLSDDPNAQGFILAALSLRGDTNGDGRLDGNDLSVGVELNRSAFSPGVELVLDLLQSNRGSLPVTGDRYVGVLPPPGLVDCPGGDPVVLLARGGAKVIRTCLSAADTFEAFDSRVSFPAGLQPTRLPGAFRFVWPAALPAGSYVWFVAVTRPGTVDVVTLGTVVMTFTP
jgi:pimeloyl-ACP methyl ester carboxylesterase